MSSIRFNKIPTILNKIFSTFASKKYFKKKVKINYLMGI